jgi:hypothetical protein
MIPIYRENEESQGQRFRIYVRLRHFGSRAV